MKTVIPENILKLLSPADRAALGKSGRTWEECQEAGQRRAERDIQGDIQNALLSRGIYFIRSAMHKRTTNAMGTPDFICCINGRLVAIEVKVPGGKLREEQSRALSHINICGGVAAVVHSYAEAVKIIDEQLKK